MQNPRDVQNSSDPEIRHQTYRISSPTWDSEQWNEKRAMGSTGIEPGPPEWKATALTTALAWSAINFTKIIEFIKYSQNGGIFIVDIGWTRVMKQYCLWLNI